MALFKILKGNEANLPEEKKEGWAYITDDTGNMYVDVSNSKRVKIGSKSDNAIEAERAKGDTLSIREKYISRLKVKDADENNFSLVGETGSGNSTNDTIAIPSADPRHAGLVTGSPQTWTGEKTFLSDLKFTTLGKGVVWENGDDKVRITVGQEQEGKTYLELATAKDGNDPIYAKQYEDGEFRVVKRTLTLLDASGNTIVPQELQAKAVQSNDEFRLENGNFYIKKDGAGYISDKLGIGTPAAANYSLQVRGNSRLDGNLEVNNILKQILAYNNSYTNLISWITNNSGQVINQPGIGFIAETDGNLNSIILLPYGTSNNLAKRKKGFIISQESLMIDGKKVPIANETGNVGNLNQPVYLRNGIITPLQHELRASIQEGIADRLPYYKTYNRIESSGHYLSTNQLGLNSIDKRRIGDNVLYVNGVSKFEGLITGTITTAQLAQNSEKLGGLDQYNFMRYMAVNSFNANKLPLKKTDTIYVVKTNPTNGAVSNHSVFLNFENLGTEFQVQMPDGDNNYFYRRYWRGTFRGWSSWEKISAGYADKADIAERVRKADGDTTPIRSTYGASLQRTQTTGDDFKFALYANDGTKLSEIDLPKASRNKAGIITNGAQQIGGFKQFFNGMQIPSGEFDYSNIKQSNNVNSDLPIWFASQNGRFGIPTVDVNKIAFNPNTQTLKVRNIVLSGADINDTFISTIELKATNTNSLTYVGKSGSGNEKTTFIIPAASMFNAGLLTSDTQDIIGSKTFLSNIILGRGMPSANFNGTNLKGMYGILNNNNGWRIGGGLAATAPHCTVELASNSPDGAAAITVKQYKGANWDSFAEVLNTLTLLDKDGHTLVPKMLKSPVVEVTDQVRAENGNFFLKSDGTGQVKEKFGIGGIEGENNFSVTGSSYLNGKVILPTGAKVEQLQTMNDYTSFVSWILNGREPSTFQPSIGQIPNGGDGTGSIILLPYATNSDLKKGENGLYISKDNAQLDGKKIPTTGNNTGTVGTEDRPVYIVNSVVKACARLLQADIKAGAANRLAFYSGDTMIDSSGHYASTDQIGINENNLVNIGDYNLYINGKTRTTGPLHIGNGTPETNHIAFYGLSGDNANRFTTTFIGENLWAAPGCSELVLYKGKDPGTNQVIVPKDVGPDRIRHIAGGHLFQIYDEMITDESFKNVCKSNRVKNILEINGNGIKVNKNAFFEDNAYIAREKSFYAPAWLSSTDKGGNYGFIGKNNKNIISIGAIEDFDDCNVLFFSNSKNYEDSDINFFFLPEKKSNGENFTDEDFAKNGAFCANRVVIKGENSVRMNPYFDLFLARGTISSLGATIIQDNANLHFGDKDFGILGKAYPQSGIGDNFANSIVFYDKYGLGLKSNFFSIRKLTDEGKDGPPMGLQFVNSKNQSLGGILCYESFGGYMDPVLVTSNSLCPVQGASLGGEMNLWNGIWTTGVKLKETSSSKEGIQFSRESKSGEVRMYCRMSEGLGLPPTTGDKGIYVSGLFGGNEGPAWLQVKGKIIAEHGFNGSVNGVLISSEMVNNMSDVDAIAVWTDGGFSLKRMNKAAFGGGGTGANSLEKGNNYISLDSLILKGTGPNEYQLPRAINPIVSCTNYNTQKKGISFISSDCAFIANSGERNYVFALFDDKVREFRQPERGLFFVTKEGHGFFKGEVRASKVYNAVWNDYAEYRASDEQEPGRVVLENDFGICQKTTKRLQPFAGVISDTWGFIQGETEQAKTPLAVAGRVLVYTFQERSKYKVGDCVCAAPGGTVDIMTRQEVAMFPDRIVGTVSEVPEYEVWGSGKSKVNGRIWIKVK